MSPILVRPVREQLEHDRVIRLLQAKYKKKFEVGINPGNEQGTPVGTGLSAWYPDLVLLSTERSRKLLGVVEVETVESINHLEAMSQWAAFSRLKVPFSLYVPAGMLDVARRFCVDLHIAVTEVWTYHTLGDQTRFTLVQRAPGSDDSSSVRAATRRPRVPEAGAARPAHARASKPGAVKPGAAKPGVVKPGVAKPGAAKPAAKAVRRAAPPTRQIAKSAKSTRTAARPVTKKAVLRAATKRK